MKSSTADKVIEALVKRLADIRQEKGLSMNRLAELAGLDQVAISRIEKGERSPQLRTVLLMCEALDVSLADLLDEGKA